jgi:hypothetical protein
MDDTILDNKYQIVRSLGEGGFGQVWLAEDNLIGGHQVAIKVLKNFDTEDARLLIEEMQYLSSLDHPHIVGFLHHFHESGRTHLVMEYCAQGSLANVAKNEVSSSQVFGWGKVLADTFCEIHRRGIVHHDIKPQNLLLTDDDRLKVADFGVANRNWGTNIYMAPELFLAGEVDINDERVDIYALGITLLELLMGANPLLGHPDRDLLQEKIQHDFVPHYLEGWAQEILLKATHPTPEQRFQSMEDFSNAIVSRHVPYILDGNRIKAHRVAEKAQRLLDRKKWQSAEKNCLKALHVAPDCVAALIVAGRVELMLKRVTLAKEYFSKALILNPRVRVQKELGWIALEEEYYSRAISMLSDHLQREPADFEALNLLLQCFYLTDRYEIGEQLATLAIEQGATNSCFVNNQFLFRLLDDTFQIDKFEHSRRKDISNPFGKFNFDIAKENPSSWGSQKGPALKSKLLFQDYRFGVTNKRKKKETMCFKNGEEGIKPFTTPLIALGRLESNDISFKRNGVSRRHAVVLNYPDDVWVYDLGSVMGVKVDGIPVQTKTFMDGVHTLDIGAARIEVATKESLLI